MNYRIRVTHLHRIGPPLNEGWFYFTPDGHAIGPFDYKGEMEADIEKYYNESDPYEAASTSTNC